MRNTPVRQIETAQSSCDRKARRAAPHRSYYYAMGMTEAEIHQPLVGVATCWNEAAPCKHIAEPGRRRR